MSTISAVYQRGEPRFDMVGQSLPNTLHDTGEVVSAGLCKRLFRYATEAMDDAGFAVDGWDCEIYTMDGDCPPSERMYCVEFYNKKGGRIGLQGILTTKGRPTLDHGFSIDFNYITEPAK